MSESPVTVHLTQRQDYQFDTRFGNGVGDLRVDEPPPLGRGDGPSPIQMLCTSVGSCLSASLLFALRKYRQQPEPIGCSVTAEVGRNADKRLRVLGMNAQLTLGVPAARLEHLDRVLATFEDFCTVTGSVRAAFPVSVAVLDADGVKLK